MAGCSREHDSDRIIGVWGLPQLRSREAVKVANLAQSVVKMSNGRFTTDIGYIIDSTVEIMLKFACSRKESHTNEPGEH